MYFYGGSIKKLKDAAMVANWLLTSSEFYDEIEKVKTFTHSNEDGFEVSRKLKNNRHIMQVNVKEYKSLWPWSKAIGYFSKRRPRDINVNIRKIDSLDVWDYIGNYIHEKMHMLGYSHKGNNKYKHNNVDSVPYLVGYIAKSVARKKFSGKL